MLDEAGAGVVLAMRQLLFGDAAPGRVHESGSARGGALVEGEDEVGGDAGSFVAGT